MIGLRLLPTQELRYSHVHAQLHNVPFTSTIEYQVSMCPPNTAVHRENECDLATQRGTRAEPLLCEFSLRQTFALQGSSREPLNIVR